MMNSPMKKPYRYFKWQNLLILFTLLFLLVSALPNLYVDKVKIELLPINSSVQQITTTELKDLFNQQNLSVDEIHVTSEKTTITYGNKANIKSINSLLYNKLKDDYLIEINKVNSLPSWLESLNAKPIKLGLDLSGGVLFVLDVDTKQALFDRLKSIALAIKTLAMEARIRGVNVIQSKASQFAEAHQQNLSVSFPNVAKSKVDTLFSKLKAIYPELSQQKDQHNQVTLSYSSKITAQFRQETMQQTLKTMRGRIAELGITEAVTQQQGKNHIRIELPGVHDPEEAKRIIGATASLDFYQLAENSKAAGILRMSDEHGRTLTLNSQVVFSGSNIKDARAGQDQMSMPLVNLTLDAIGGKKMSQFSKQNIGNTMVTVFSEFYRNAENQMVKKSKVINVATIQQHLGSIFSITNMSSQQAAQELSLLLRAGSLTAPVTIVKQRTIEASLGENNIKNGIKALSVGISITLLFMFFWYRSLGVIANIALTLNLISLLGLMSLLPGAVLTLPGIAGLVLTVGMAVDTNVLIFERIKEELKRGHKVLSAIEQGYKSAFSTILDANITTMITGIILYTIGNGPVKGFALILCLGILTSMFTGVFVSKVLTNMVIRKNKTQLLGVNV
jgi:preprotein translocase subunit SecD